MDRGFACCVNARVIAIDAGTRNFAYCVVDATNWRRPLVWEKEDLWAPVPGRRRKPSKTDMVKMGVDWLRRNERLLATCTHVVLENQLRTPYIVLNACIQAVLFEKTEVVHPMKVGSFWCLPPTRDEKKARGIEVVRENHVVFPQLPGKLDDHADAWLMAVHKLVQLGAVHKNDLIFHELEPKKRIKITA